MIKKLLSLSIYRPLLQMPPLCHLLRALRAKEAKNEQEMLGALGELCAFLAQNGTADSLPTAVLTAVQGLNNPYAQALASGKPISKAVRTNALRDLETLYLAATVPYSCFGDGAPYYGRALPDAPFDAPWHTVSAAWEQFHRQNGCGPFALHNAFVWQGGAVHAVRESDPIRLSSLKGYPVQRKILIDNTEAFLRGAPANHILLYGDRGTGKSSSVKALLHEYAHKGLRIIQIPKEELLTLPALTEQLADIPCRFLLFVDDLSFKTDDDRISSLKAVLEGGLACQPSNVLIYATSNRLHLVRESDRNGAERRAADTVQEEISLSDRFGITLTFLLPDRVRFFEIVEAIAAENGLDIEREKLLAAAERWATEHGGRSPRYARQFVQDLCAKGGVL